MGGSLPPPKFAKDDSVISKKATPRDKGARPCRHCGSDLHWDPECHHAKKSMRTAHTRLAECTVDKLEAQDTYNELYYGLSDGEQDFEYSLRITDAAQTFKASATALEGTALQAQGKIDSINIPDLQKADVDPTLLPDTTTETPNSHTAELRAFRIGSKSTSCRGYNYKPALNR